jgi:hypothetical protein
MSSSSNVPRARWRPGLPARTTAIAARHVGCRTGFIDEDQAVRIQVGLARTPLIACLGDIRPILLGGALRLFLSGSFKN